MFYCMMAWFFWQKNRELLSRLVAVLMIVLGIQCVKDLFFINPNPNPSSDMWMFMTSTDMIAVPIYAFILVELCRPGTLSLRFILINELPFIILPIVFITTHLQLFYYADVVWTALYGGATAIWAIIGIPKYHRLLKERFSYEDNINLNWLRYILLSFFVILSLWVLDCIIVDLNIEALYMGGTLIIWMFICYFLYRHESVIDELKVPISIEDTVAQPIEDSPTLKKCLLDLFENQKIYLNPQLRLSDVAILANSNRTYVSRFFNDNHGKTFFEFVNEYRVKFAMTLLSTSDEKLDVIAEQSGFSSRQSFHRVFVKFVGCTPEQFRASLNN